jgi:hypothetical protein
LPPFTPSSSVTSPLAFVSTFFPLIVSTFTAFSTRSH